MEGKGGICTQEGWVGRGEVTGVRVDWVAWEERVGLVEQEGEEKEKEEVGQEDDSEKADLELRD